MAITAHKMWPGLHHLQPCSLLVPTKGGSTGRHVARAEKSSPAYRPVLAAIDTTSLSARSALPTAQIIKGLSEFGTDSLLWLIYIIDGFPPSLIVVLDLQSAATDLDRSGRNSFYPRIWICIVFQLKRTWNCALTL